MTIKYNDIELFIDDSVVITTNVMIEYGESLKGAILECYRLQKEHDSSMYDEDLYSVFNYSIISPYYGVNGERKIL